MNVLDFLPGMCITLSLLYIFQITFLECSRNSGPIKSSSDGIACALKVLCSEKQDFKKQQLWAVKSTELTDQCPVDGENIPAEHEFSLLKHNTFVSQIEVPLTSWEQHSGGKVATIF